MLFNTNVLVLKVEFKKGNMYKPRFPTWRFPQHDHELSMTNKHVYCDVPGSPCLSKTVESNVRFVPFRSGPPVDGPKDPWHGVLPLPGRFVGDPASLARSNIFANTNNQRCREYEYV